MKRLDRPFRASMAALIAAGVAFDAGGYATTVALALVALTCLVAACIREAEG